VVSKESAERFVVRDEGAAGQVNFDFTSAKEPGGVDRLLISIFVRTFHAIDDLGGSGMIEYGVQVGMEAGPVLAGFGREDRSDVNAANRGILEMERGDRAGVQVLSDVPKKNGGAVQRFRKRTVLPTTEILVIQGDVVGAKETLNTTGIEKSELRLFGLENGNTGLRD
jgi:hypothetical protein